MPVLSIYTYYGMPVGLIRQKPVFVLALHELLRAGAYILLRRGRIARLREERKEFA